MSLALCSLHFGCRDGGWKNRIANFKIEWLFECPAHLLCGSVLPDIVTIKACASVMPLNDGRIFQD